MHRAILIATAVLVAFSARAPLAGRLAQQAPAAPSTQSRLDYNTYVTKIQPIFLNKRTDRARCYVCHSQGTPWRLEAFSPGSTMWTDEQSRKNFEAIQRLVVPGNPAASRLLLVPLAEEAGGIHFHPGGKHFMSLNDPEWKTIADWVSAAK